MEHICKECGQVILDGAGTEIEEGVWVCDECIEEFVRCDDCGNWVKKSDITIVGNGDSVCPECLDSHYTKCEYCGEYFHNYDVTEVYNDRYGNETIWVCDECRNDNYTQCDDCGSYYPTSTMTETGTGSSICRSCRDNNYARCNSCGDWYHTDDMSWDENSQEYYCSDCYDDFKDNRILDYHDNPRTRFYGELEHGRQHFIGFELEIDRRDSDRNDERSLLDDLEEIAGDRIYFMHDGSLDYGFEIISQPHTMNELLYGLHIEDILQACRDRNYSSHDVGTCGLHFHLSREMFGPEKYRDTAIQKMMLFYDNFYGDIAKIARRTDNQLHWCRRNSDEDNSSLNVKERAEKYKQIDKNNCRHDDRYKAVNTTNHSTVEIRIMRGTLNYDTFMASLDFVYTVASNSRVISWNKTTDASEWLKGLKPETIEYIKKHHAFTSYLQ